MISIDYLAPSQNGLQSRFGLQENVKIPGVWYLKESKQFEILKI